MSHFFQVSGSNDPYHMIDTAGVLHVANRHPKDAELGLSVPLRGPDPRAPFVVYSALAESQPRVRRFRAPRLFPVRDDRIVVLGCTQNWNRMPISISRGSAALVGRPNRAEVSTPLIRLKFVRLSALNAFAKTLTCSAGGCTRGRAAPQVEHLRHVDVGAVEGGPCRAVARNAGRAVVRDGVAVVVPPGRDRVRLPAQCRPGDCQEHAGRQLGIDRRVELVPPVVPTAPVRREIPAVRWRVEDPLRVAVLQLAGEDVVAGHREHPQPLPRRHAQDLADRSSDGLELEDVAARRVRAVGLARPRSVDVDRPVLVAAPVVLERRRGQCVAGQHASRKGHSVSVATRNDFVPLVSNFSMLEARHLLKRFSGVTAVRDVSFVLRPGDVVGYLGPNGSGKTTTVRMLTGLLEPTSGKVLCEGGDIQDDVVAFRRRLGYVPEEPHLYPFLSGREYLQLVGRLREIPHALLEKKIDAFLTLFAIADAADQSISAYSKGMKQKVLISSALLHDPDVLILDEPESGLDVTTALVLRHLIARLADQGKAVLYSSHVLEVVEKVCSKVLVLHGGQVVADDSVARLRVLMSSDSLADVFSQLVLRHDPEQTARDLAGVVAMRA